MTTTNENTAVRFVPMASGVSVRFEIDMVTGVVSRYGSFYRVALKTAEARRLFLAGVGIVFTNEVPAFIVECNKRATAKPVKSAKPHNPKACKYPKCQVAHVGCRRLNCPVCL